jgi:hypothetical protein
MNVDGIARTASSGALRKEGVENNVEVEDAMV